MKTYTYKAKDGTLITGIPEEISTDDPRLFDFYKQMKSAGQDTAPFGQLALTPEQAAAVDPEAAGGTAGAPPPVIAPVQKPSVLDIAGQAIKELPQNAGVAARGFVEGAMSLPTMVADPVTEMINKILPPEYQQLPPSQGIEAMFAKLGVKDPQTKAQEVLESLTMGLGSSAAGLGTGAALSAGAPALGMGTKIQGIGQTLAANPAADLSGSAASMGASKIAEQQGASPLVQGAIGLGAGLGASRLASPAAAIKTAATQSEDEIGDVIRKAASGDKAARKTVADLSAIDPQAREAARRLEIELPADVFSDNEQVRAAAGLGRSIVGGTEEAAWRGTVKNAVERADQVLDEFGATFIEGAPAPAVASARVKDSLMATRKELKDAASKIYDEIDEAVPKATPIKLDNLRAELQKISDELGGEGFTPLEKQLLDVSTDESATYGRLMRIKSDIRKAVEKNDGPYKDIEEATKIRLRNSILQDQLDNVSRIGSPELKEKLVAANLMYGKQRDVGKQIINLFGKDFAGSISDKMRMAITSSARGETGAFTRLMDSVPDDLKKEVTATALASIARSGAGATKGQFGFSEFSKMYQGLRANKEVYKQVVKNLGPESDAVLRDLYEVSKRVTDARANVLTTGKANQALLQGLTAQNLIEKALSSVIGRGVIAAGGAATGSALGGGAFGASTGAGISSAIVESLTRGEKTKLEAVGKLFRSKDFQDLIVNAGKTDTITPAQAKALARSAAFQSFAKAVKLPVATDQLDTWILSAMAAKTADMVNDGIARKQAQESER